MIRRAHDLFADRPLEIEARKQAHFHLWHEERSGPARHPLRDSLHGISSFLVLGTSVGIAPDFNRGGVRLAAPYGLEDIFSGILRSNKCHGLQAICVATAAR